VTDEEKLFADLANEMASDTANDLLERQAAKTRKWIAQREAAGEPATFKEFLNQIVREPNKKTHVMAAYGAALWRMATKGEL
jgi:hypothetical protein